MSKQAAIEFLDKVSTDSTLQHKLSFLPRDNVNILLKIAAEEGYLFTAEDYYSAEHDLADAADELSDTELSSIAGGVGGTRIPGIHD
jgi:predicted ribosomally synthesized peptide with nif11-like leader